MTKKDKETKNSNTIKNRYIVPIQHFNIINDHVHDKAKEVIDSIDIGICLKRTKILFFIMVAMVNNAKVVHVDPNDIIHTCSLKITSEQYITIQQKLMHKDAINDLKALEDLYKENMELFVEHNIKYNKYSHNTVIISQDSNGAEDDFDKLFQILNSENLPSTEKICLSLDMLKNVEYFKSKSHAVVHILIKKCFNYFYDLNTILKIQHKNEKYQDSALEFIHNELITIETIKRLYVSLNGFDIIEKDLSIEKCKVNNDYTLTDPEVFEELLTKVLLHNIDRYIKYIADINFFDSYTLTAYNISPQCSSKPNNKTETSEEAEKNSLNFEISAEMTIAGFIETFEIIKKNCELASKECTSVSLFTHSEISLHFFNMLIDVYCDKGNEDKLADKHMIIMEKYFYNGKKNDLFRNILQIISNLHKITKISDNQNELDISFNIDENAKLLDSLYLENLDEIEKEVVDKCANLAYVYEKIFNMAIHRICNNHLDRKIMTRDLQVSLRNDVDYLAYFTVPSDGATLQISNDSESPITCITNEIMNAFSIMKIQLEDIRKCSVKLYEETSKKRKNKTTKPKIKDNAQISTISDDQNIVLSSDNIDDVVAFIEMENKDTKQKDIKKKHKKRCKRKNKRCMSEKSIQYTYKCISDTNDKIPESKQQSKVNENKGEAIKSEATTKEMNEKIAKAKGMTKKVKGKVKKAKKIAKKISDAGKRIKKKNKKDISKEYNKQMIERKHEIVDKSKSSKPINNKHKQEDVKREGKQCAISYSDNNKEDDKINYNSKQKQAKTQKNGQYVTQNNTLKTHEVQNDDKKTYYINDINGNKHNLRSEHEIKKYKQKSVTFCEQDIKKGKQKSVTFCEQSKHGMCNQNSKPILSNILKHDNNNLGIVYSKEHHSYLQNMQRVCYILFLYPSLIHANGFVSEYKAPITVYDTDGQSRIAEMTCNLCYLIEEKHFIMKYYIKRGDEYTPM